jgi:hypothetical protein
MVLLGDSRVPLNCAVLMDRVWLSTAHNTRVTDYSGATVPGLHRLPHPSRRVSIIRSGAQRCQTYAGAAGLFGADPAKQVCVHDPASLPPSARASGLDVARYVPHQGSACR